MNIDKYNNKHNLNEILFIDKQSVEDFYDDIKDIYSQDDLLDIEKNYFNKNGLMAIGSINNEIVAMCGFIPESYKIASLMRLRVRKDLRGDGLGKKILKYIESAIREKGYETIKFSTAASRVNTLHFYRKRGYKEIAREMYGEIETVIFEKNLTSVG